MAFRILCVFATLTIAGCATARRETPKPLCLPYLPTSMDVNGKLDEVYYRQHAPLTSFVVAAHNAREASSTKAWVFWSEDGLICAFECVDPTPAWATPSPNESEVDGQDRVELFLWPGDPTGPYFCIEAVPGGAVHDYQARFYRKFDDAWAPAAGWQHEALLTPHGYTVEMSLPKPAIEAMGLKLEPGAQFKIGLFRADFDTLNGHPTWITWIDHGREPDFHLAESFGTASLTPAP